MTQRDKEEAGMKGTGRARASNQTICLCSDPYGHAEVWLGKRRAHTTSPTLSFLLPSRVSPAGVRQCIPGRSPARAVSSRGADSPSAPLPPPTFLAWLCLIPVSKVRLFPPLFLCTPGTELYGGGATPSLSIERVIFHLVSYRHEVFAIAACVFVPVCACVSLLSFASNF